MKKLINFGIVFRSFGISLVIVGLFMLTCIPFAIYYNENTIAPIVISAMITFCVGILLSTLTRRSKNSDIGQREAFIVVTATWFMLGFFGSLPFLFTGSIPLFTDAYFETISGFTTTGASILSDIEAVPKSILYWRSAIQWLGGMGILVLVIAVIPHIGFGGAKVFDAEVPGPSNSKIHPKIRQTALRLWEIYSVLTLIEITLLYFGEMDLFESICHSMTTLSTGGFSPKNTSIVNYSAYSQIVITVFMFLGGLNFALHYYLIRGKLKKVITNEELLSYLGLIVFLAVIISGITYFNSHYETFGVALRHGFFQIVSIITTTGFATADYVLWPQSSWFLLLLVFFIGGNIGSTGGGIKFTRLYVLIKNIRAELKRFIHPKAIISIKLNKKPIPEETIRNFFIIFVAYLFIFCLGTILLSLFIDSPIESIGVSITCLGNVGPAFGQYGPVGNFAELHVGGKWIASILMIIGRLEVIPILIFFHYSFWKK
jgi:trk system potassium uptake protein